MTVYKPNPERLIELATSLSSHVARVYIFANGDLDPALRRVLVETPNVQLVEAGQNFGVGVALNLLGLVATLGGFQKLCLFDQDAATIPDLISALDERWAMVERLGHRPAVVAPRLISPASSGPWKSPSYTLVKGKSVASPPLSQVWYAPTSGSLISLSRLRATGWFRADYFVDGIDIEWCYRAKAHGLSCWIAEDLRLQHTIGTGVISWPLLNFSMPKQEPFRMYCAFRNAIYGLRLRHIPVAWKCKQIFYIPIQAVAYLSYHRFRGSILKRMAAGVRDGIRASLGPPEEFRSKCRSP